MDRKYGMFKKVQGILRTAQDTLVFPAEMKYMGHHFTLLPDVFAFPDLNRRPCFSDLLPAPAGEGAVWEIGSGCGCVVISYYLDHKDKVKRLLASDLTEDAVLNTKVNLERHGVTCGEARQGDLFGAAKDDEKFDLIFWGAPFFLLPENEEMTTLDKSIGDIGYKTIERYLTGVRKHLTSAGRAFLGFSGDFGDIDAVMDIAGRHGVKLDLFASRKSEEQFEDSHKKGEQLYEILEA